MIGISSGSHQGSVTPVNHKEHTNNDEKKIEKPEKKKKHRHILSRAGIALCQISSHPFVPVLYTPKHQYAYSPYCSLYISLGADKENLFNN